MKIQYNNKGFDFKAPIFMNDEQFNLFNKFLEKTFGEHYKGKEDIKEMRQTRPDNKREMQKWTTEHLFELYVGKDDYEIAKKLNRHVRAVQMKGADFCPLIDKMLIDNNIKMYEATDKQILEFIKVIAK